MNPGGPPTPGKPGVSMVDHRSGDTTLIFLNLRVAEIQACDEERKAKGGRVRYAADRPRSRDPLLHAGPGRIPHRGRPVHRPAAWQALRKTPGGSPGRKSRSAVNAIASPAGSAISAGAATRRGRRERFLRWTRTGRGRAMPGAHGRDPLAGVLGLVVSRPHRHPWGGAAGVPGRTYSLDAKHPGQSPGSSGKRWNHAPQPCARTGTACPAAARRAMLPS
jgi:hypothetical protein